MPLVKGQDCWCVDRSVAVRAQIRPYDARMVGLESPSSALTPLAWSFFEREPLELVASEFNRYTARPIEIMTPRLRSLEISGVFATDDTEAFLAFLRSLEGVRVEVTATQIRVSQN